MKKEGKRSILLDATPLPNLVNSLARCEWPPQELVAAMEDASEDSAVQDFLQILEEHRKNCERQGKYVEAEIGAQAPRRWPLKGAP